MYLRKKLSLLALIICLVSPVWAGGQKEGAAEQKEIKWKLAGFMRLQLPRLRVLIILRELVKEKSNGNFIIEVYPAGQLGKDAVVLVEKPDDGFN